MYWVEYQNDIKIGGDLNTKYIDPAGGYYNQTPWGKIVDAMRSNDFIVQTNFIAEMYLGFTKPIHEGSKFLDSHNVHLMHGNVQRWLRSLENMSLGDFPKTLQVTRDLQLDVESLVERIALLREKLLAKFAKIFSDWLGKSGPLFLASVYGFEDENKAYCAQRAREIKTELLSHGTRASPWVEIVKHSDWEIIASGETWWYDLDISSPVRDLGVQFMNMKSASAVIERYMKVPKKLSVHLKGDNLNAMAELLCNFLAFPIAEETLRALGDRYTAITHSYDSVIRRTNGIVAGLRRLHHDVEKGKGVARKEKRLAKKREKLTALQPLVDKLEELQILYRPQRGFARRGHLEMLANLLDGVSGSQNSSSKITMEGLMTKLANHPKKSEFLAASEWEYCRRLRKSQLSPAVKEFADGGPNFKPPRNLTGRKRKRTRRGRDKSGTKRVQKRVPRRRGGKKRRVRRRQRVIEDDADDSGDFRLSDVSLDGPSGDGELRDDSMDSVEDQDFDFRDESLDLREDGTEGNGINGQLADFPLVEEENAVQLAESSEDLQGGSLYFDEMAFSDDFAPDFDVTSGFVGSSSSLSSSPPSPKSFCTPDAC